MKKLKHQAKFGSSTKQVNIVIKSDEVSTEHQSILDDVGETLNGFYRVGVIKRDGTPSLKMYGDDGAISNFEK